jgi:membrane protease YdiL (CAAX protease family)
MLSPSAIVALAVELALMLVGLALLWRLQLSPAARAQRQPPALTEWTIPLPDFALFAWCVIAGGLLGQLAMIQGLRLLTLDGDTRQVLAGAAFQLGMLGGCAGFAFFAPGGRDFARPRGSFLRAGLATFAIALPLLVAVGLIWALLLQLVGLPAERQELIGLFTEATSPLLLGSLVALASVVAPVTEELVFRAGIFRYGRTRLPRWAALLLPAVLFGALHGNLASFAQLVTLGVLFSLAYERTGNIAVPMVAHALFNLNTIALILSGIDL